MFNDFINEIREKEIVITFLNGKLQYSGPEQYIDEDLIAKLKKYKQKLLKYYWPSDCLNMMPINTEGNKIPFTILHAGKANYSLSEYFGIDQPFYGFFYLGSEGEKIRYKSLESFAKEYLKQLQMIIPTGPYLLGGLSFGGILAYEIAIQLQKQGHDVPFLALVDCGIPKYLKSDDTSPLLIRILKTVYHFFQNILYWFYHNCRRILYETFDLLKINLPANFRRPYILWTYFHLMRKYRPTTKYNGEILLFKAEANNSNNKYLGWNNLCEKVQVVSMKGDHATMYESKESIEVLREKIGEFLQKANNIKKD